MNWKTFGISTLVAIAGALILFCLAQSGDDSLLFLFMELMAICVLPLLFFLLAVFVYWKLRANKEKAAITTGRCAGLLLFLILSIPALVYLETSKELRTEKAKVQATETAVTLEAFRQQKGHYPCSLRDAQEAGFPISIPVEGPSAFHYECDKDGTSYGIRMDSWWFWSTSREWMRD